MGNNSYTSADLINNIKLVSHIPTAASQTFSDSDILTLANRELQTALINQILSTRGGYYLTYTDYDRSDDGLYMIPSGAIAGSLANIEFVQNTAIIQVNLLEESEQFSTNAPTSISYGFFMRGNYIQILPLPGVGSCRIWYNKRPSTIILTSNAGEITSVSTNDITVSSVPSTLTTGSIVDICGDQPPFNVIGTSVITNIAGSVITIADTITGITSGDWICLSEQTPVPPIPVEYRPLLEQRVVVKMYEIQGYKEKMDVAIASLKELERNTLMLITPRVKSQTRVVNPVNGGFLIGNPNRLTNFPAGRIP